MDKFNNVKTIFFDFDGTLHNSIKIYAPAFRKAFIFLVENGYAKAREWSDEEISHWLGYNKNEMWDEFMPLLDEKIKSTAGRIIGDEMNNLLETGSGKLYKNTLKVLSELKSKGYTLVFLSNCSMAYKETVIEIFGLGKFFEEAYCSEEFDFIPKYEIFEKVRSKFSEKMVIVGDRYKDMEVAIKNGIMSIGCKYGFGKRNELNEATESIGSIEELLNIF